MVAMPPQGGFQFHSDWPHRGCHGLAASYPVGVAQPELKPGLG